MYLKSIERGVSVVGDTACMFIVDIGVGDTIIVIVEMGIAVIVVGDTTIVNFELGDSIRVVVMISGRKGCYTFFF